MCICLVNGHWTCSLASIWIREVFNDPWGQDRTQLSRWMATILIFYWIPWLVSHRNWWNCFSRPQFSIVLSGDPSSVMSSIFWFFMQLRSISFLGSCVEVAGARSALPAMWWPHPFNFKLLEKLYVYNSLQKAWGWNPLVEISGLTSYAPMADLHSADVSRPWNPRAQSQGWRRCRGVLVLWLSGSMDFISKQWTLRPLGFGWYQQYLNFLQEKSLQDMTFHFCSVHMAAFVQRIMSPIKQHQRHLPKLKRRQSACGW